MHVQQMQAYSYQSCQRLGQTIMLHFNRVSHHVDCVTWMSQGSLGLAEFYLIYNVAPREFLASLCFISNF